VDDDEVDDDAGDNGEEEDGDGNGDACEGGGHSLATAAPMRLRETTLQSKRALGHATTTPMPPVQALP
jgi:hypothetical protein